MSENEKSQKCPRCGAALGADAPEGMCPRCLMALHLVTQTQAFGPGGTRPTPPRPEPPPIAEIAKLFPQFEILEFIGRGGMGVVYKARQPKLNRIVALKVLVPDAEKGAHFAERFQREAQALAKLNHPNIVAVHDFGEAGGFYFLAMEFVEGANLRELLGAEKFKPEEALAIVPRICDALEYAHSQGVVHRDIKPENILLDKQGRVKIADFGIAKILGSEGQSALTGEQQAIGTPHYMAPEQIERPTTVDHRADIYSLGVVFYEMLTGELPLGKFQPPSAKVQMDVRLDEVVLRSLEKEPERRYQQASDVRTRVEAIVQSPTAPGAPSAQDVLAHDYFLNIGHCLGRGWNLVRANFWPLVGVYALMLALSCAAASNHVGAVIALILSGPLSGGLFLYFLRTIRGERPNVETAFAGFSSRFLPLFLGDFVVTLLGVLGLICFVLPGVYLFVAWKFTLILIIDRRLDFWSAMELSRKVISRHWWKFLGFALLLLLIQAAGILCFLIGFLVAGPVALAALLYAYEDIFGTATVAATPPGGKEASLIGIALGAFAAILFVAILGLLSAVAIPNFVRARQMALHNVAHDLTQEGWQSFQNQQFSRAQDKFTQAVEKDPENPDAWSGLGWSLFDTGHATEAQTNFQKALSLNTNMPGVLNGLGQIYLSKRNYGLAETYLLKAAPQAPAAYFGLARLYLLRGNYEQAQIWSQKLLDSGQDDEDARQFLKAAEEKHLSEELRRKIEPPR